MTQSRKIRPVVSDEVNQRETGVRDKAEDKASGQIISCRTWFRSSYLGAMETTEGF